MREKRARKISVACILLLAALFLPSSAVADTCTDRSLYSALQTESGSFLTDVVEQMRLAADDQRTPRLAAGPASEPGFHQLAGELPERRPVLVELHQDLGAGLDQGPPHQPRRQEV